MSAMHANPAPAGNADRRGRLIAVEGPIGAGTTTLARRLAERLGFTLILEPVEENVFLDRFYDDRRALAFRTQLFFLVNRFHQQRQVEELLAAGGDVVADYAFSKDRLFARLNLAADELALYEEIYSLIAPRAPRPDALALLQCDVDLLLERIRARSRPFERSLSRDYLERVVAAYAGMANEATLLLDGTSAIDQLAAQVESSIRAGP
jgi:deoxyadenosine/deoxycytidine kinase